MRWFNRSLRVPIWEEKPGKPDEPGLRVRVIIFASPEENLSSFDPFGRPVRWLGKASL